MLAAMRECPEVLGRYGSKCYESTGGAEPESYESTGGATRSYENIWF